MKKDGKKREEPPPLTDSEPSKDEDDELDSQSQTDTETKCRSCSFNVELPMELEESNQVFINRESGEILIFPKDETRNEEEWIQRSVIEGTSQEDESDKICYAKGDSQKLEKFLRQEREGTARIIKQRCLEHSKKCEACDILSRRMESQKETTLIKEVWDNVNAEEGPDGRYVIKHAYVHRHNVAETFPPWRSNIREARKQAKKVIFKAKKQANLSEPGSPD